MRFRRFCAAAVAAASLAVIPAIGLAGPAAAVPCADCGGGGGGGGGGTGGGTTGPKYVFVPVRLICNDIEDAWPDWRDEINLYYGDKTYTDPAISAGKVDVGLPASTFTGATLRLDLWEMDNGWTNHNHLGMRYVTSTDLGQERTETFSGPGYSYDLVYKVIRG